MDPFSQYRPTSIRGECDVCHQHAETLWEDETGYWLLCRRCARAEERSRARERARLRRARLREEYGWAR